MVREFNLHRASSLTAAPVCSDTSCPASNRVVITPRPCACNVKGVRRHARSEALCSAPACGHVRGSPIHGRRSGCGVAWGGGCRFRPGRVRDGLPGPCHTGRRACSRAGRGGVGLASAPGQATTGPAAIPVTATGPASRRRRAERGASREAHPLLSRPPRAALADRAARAMRQRIRPGECLESRGLSRPPSRVTPAHGGRRRASRGPAPGCQRVGPRAHRQAGRPGRPGQTRDVRDGRSWQMHGTDACLHALAFVRGRIKNACKCMLHMQSQRPTL